MHTEIIPEKLIVYIKLILSTRTPNTNIGKQYKREEIKKGYKIYRS